MNARSAGAAATSPAVDTLVELGEQGASLCPPDTDPHSWAADVLHDLARVAQLVGSAVQQITGEKNTAIERHSHALSTALDAQGNLQLLHRHP
jgi:hypothetical protein